MGGFNSGRRGGKPTTGSMAALDIRKMPVQPSALAFQFDCHGRGYTIPIVRTPCYFGGQRPWWLCPQCGERVAVVYLGKKIGCRTCLDLAYQSDRTAKSSKPFARVNKVRAKLGWAGGVASPMGGKPKGMHWATYARLTTEHVKRGMDTLRISEAVYQRIHAQLAKIKMR